MKYILASKSPRRKELLKYIIKDFDIMVSDIDETFNINKDIKDESMRVAHDKALSIFNKTIGDRCIIASDTIVVKNNKLYGKPKDKKQAFKYIKELSNSCHEVITSICVIVESNNIINTYKDYDITKVYIDYMTDEEINNWINKESCLDKAGAYAIQEEFSKYIKKIDGNVDSVIGLPVNLLYKYIKSINNN